MNIAEVLENLKSDPRSTAVILSAMYTENRANFKWHWETLTTDDAMELARALHEFYVEKGIKQLQKYNGESDPLGFLTGQNTLQFTSELPHTTMGSSNYKLKLNSININRLACKYHQCDQIFETIPHEVAHLLHGTLLFDHGPQGLTKAGEVLFMQSFARVYNRNRRYRITLNGAFMTVGAKHLAHGKIWKQIYRDLTGWPKIKGRLFNEVVVSASKKRTR